MKTKKEVFKCDYFTVEELTAGVYAAYAMEEGGALSNSGIIDLGDTTVVFDTFLSVYAAQELRKLAEKITGRKAAYVINSHSHFDHVLGNCAFDTDTPVIASLKTLNILKAQEKEIDSMKKDAPQILGALKKQLQEEPNVMSGKMLERDIRYFEMIGDDSFSLRLPDITMEGSHKIEGASRKVLLTELEGHTDSDIMLYLPEEKIAFMGDLLFTGTHPWLGAGNPEQWLKTLKRIQGYDLKVLVPGHGYAGGVENINLLEEYMRMIEHIAARLLAGECKQEDIGEEMLGEPFKGWKGNKFLPNVKFYSQYLDGVPGRVQI